jgi:phosphatidylglycerophosphatase A
MTQLAHSRILNRMQPATAKRSSFSWLLATFFGVGYAKPGPGTYASAVTVLLWVAAARSLPAQTPLITAIAASVAITMVGIPVSTNVARESGRKDPGFVVIDEVAGQMIAMIGLPINWKYLLASFILFRGFDILKPFPLRRLEKLPGGIGIMMDDVGAGLYALLILHLWRHFVVG